MVKKSWMISYNIVVICTKLPFIIFVRSFILSLSKSDNDIALITVFIIDFVTKKLVIVGFDDPLQWHMPFVSNTKGIVIW